MKLNIQINFEKEIIQIAITSKLKKYRTEFKVNPKTFSDLRQFFYSLLYGKKIEVNIGFKTMPL